MPILLPVFQRIDTHGWPLWLKLLYVAFLFGYAGIMFAGAYALWRKSR